jgi:hypothetical protein
LAAHGQEAFPAQEEELRCLKRELEVTRQERDSLKKAFIVFSKTERRDISSFETTSREYLVKSMCRVLGVSESGYYTWCTRLPSRCQGENEQLVEHMRSAYDQGRHVYGSPRIHAELRAQGIVCGKHRVARLMQQAGLCAGKSTTSRVHNL